MEQQNQKSKINKFLLTYFIATIVIIGVVSVGFTAKLHNIKENFRDHGPFGFIMEMVVKDLDLTDAQKKEVDAIRDEVKNKMQEKKKDREQDMEQFGNMFKQDKLDKDQMLSMASKHDADRE